MNFGGGNVDGKYYQSLASWRVTDGNFPKQYPLWVYNFREVKATC
ncbi:hypothetical protein VB796_12815 [Arcicella sp. LKC2W]|nr:hypothetical protein [Arcicella sp. LKC2W]MEA5459929.1 hypothetical protein [Arcicella sp. LKC2W]